MVINSMYVSKAIKSTSIKKPSREYAFVKEKIENQGILRTYENMVQF
jgi:hypothetical protein